MAGYARSEPSCLANMWLTLALSILQVIPTHLDKAEAQTQAITDMNEIRQILELEEVALKNEYTSQGFSIEEKNNVGIPTIRVSPLKPWSGELNFDPPLLDFGEVAIGMPKIESVRVFNPLQTNSLRMVSISGSTPHFHCSFFQEKVIPPGGNTTFDIVFLPRLAGNVENTIFIHSEEGTAPYQVFGVGVPNPYRLRPIIGARVPINTSFSPLINMHNPYSSALMVTEMYSSGGDLHLELPTGSQEAPQNLWEIPPYQTRSVMRASFTGRVESNHTAFIRIKTNHSHHSHMDEGEFLMLPVEVEVSSAPGLYTSLELIDFGTLRSLDEPKTIQLYLLNTSPKTVQITSVSLVRANQAINIDFKPVELPMANKHKNVANITFYPLKANYSRFWSGKIIVKTKDKNLKLQIPYQAHVLPGTLSVIRNNTLFHLLDPPHRKHVERKLPLSNFFNFSIVIHQVALPSNTQGTFQIKNFTSPMVIPPQETDCSLSLAFTPNDTMSSLSTTLRLGTNASVFTIPVYAYTGRFKYFVNGEKVNQLDLGTTGISDYRSLVFVVSNENPVEVLLKRFSCTLESCTLVLSHIGEGNGTGMRSDFPSFFTTLPQSDVIIPANHYALLHLEVKTPTEEGQHIGEVYLETPFEETRLPTTLKTIKGSLAVKPEAVHFPASYPGLLQSQSISILNGFSHRMSLESLNPEPPDERFFFKPPKKLGNVEVESDKKQKIGKIYFDARKYCTSDCYVGLPTTTPDGQMWLSSLTLPEETQDMDRLFFNFRRNKWLKLQESGSTIINTTMKLRTNLVKEIDIPVTAKLKWPKLASKEKVPFSMTYVDTVSKNSIVINNPTESTIILQLLPITAYKDPSVILDLLSDRFDPEQINLNEPNPFHLKDIGKKDCRGQCFQTYHQAIEDTYGIKPNSTTMTVALKPKQNITLHLTFRPYNNREKISLIVIRNNLTVLDGFLVHGTGASGELRLNNKLPGVNSNLVFDLKIHHLNDCDRSHPKSRNPPHFTVKRTLTIKNTGQIGLHIHSWYINGLYCEGYGFRILQCHAMDIKPNDTARLDITFCPDFSLARVVRTLQIKLLNNELLEYNLIATLPHHMLATCSTAVPRPSWEMVMYYICLGLMCFFLVVIITVSYLEAVRFMEPMPEARKLLKERYKAVEMENLKRFDLREIGKMKIDGSAGMTGKVKDGGGGGGGASNKTNQKNGVLGNFSNKFSLRHKSSLNNKQPDSRHPDSKPPISKDKMRVNDLQNSTTAHTIQKDRTVMSSKARPTNTNQELSSKRSNRIKQKHTADNEPTWTNEGKTDITSSYQEPTENVADSTNQETKDIYNDTQSERSISSSNNSRYKRKHKIIEKQPEKMEKPVLKPSQSEEVREIHDQDEISSTTTEESAPDSEQMERLSNQSMNQLDDFSWPKDHMSKLDTFDIDEDVEENSFRDVKSRSKSRKNLYKNGDINNKMSLELPYTTHQVSRKKRSRTTVVPNSKEPTSPHSIAAKVTANATKKAQKGRGADSDTTSTASSERDKGSPPPLWEETVPLSSNHTQHPVAYHRHGHVPSAGARNAPFVSGNGQKKNKAAPSSYSSAVSGKSSSAKKAKLGQTKSAPGSASAFTFVGDRNSSMSGVPDMKDFDPSSIPWVLPSRDGDSASDTSSGTSTGPSSPGAFPMPPSKMDFGLSGPAKLQGPGNKFPYSNDDMGVSVWNNRSSKERSKSSSLPFNHKVSPSAANTFSPNSAGINPGGDYLGFGMSRAPASSRLWEPPPGFPNPPTTNSLWSTDTNAAPPSQPNYYSPAKSSAIWDTSINSPSDDGWRNTSSELFPSDSIWSSPESSGASLLDTSGVQESEETPRGFGLFGSSIWAPPSSNGMWSLWSTPTTQNN